MNRKDLAQLVAVLDAIEDNDGDARLAHLEEHDQAAEQVRRFGLAVDGTVQR